MASVGLGTTLHLPIVRFRMDVFRRRWKMRTIGIDLALNATHKAVVADDRGTVITPVIRFHTEPEKLRALMKLAREGKADDEPLRVVMEPTGLAWLPLASYFIQRGVTVHLVSTQQSADLRKFYSKHAKSDRISARVLVRFPWVLPQELRPLELADAYHGDGQRWCKQREELADLMTSIKNRVQAWERAFWPGLEEIVDDLFSPWMRRWREAFYDPWKLQELETCTLAAFMVEAGAGVEKAESLAAGLQAVARRAVALFGTLQGGSSPYANYASLQDQVLRELRLLATYEQEHRSLQRQVRELYRRMHPARNLETIKGVGEGGASVYLFFIGKVERFARQKHFRGWSGMVPESDQSGDADKKGLRMTKAGPDLVKKYAYINAEVARQWDPQIAAIYHDQMVNKGKHHVQAVCHCATHLLDRVRAVLRDDRPYELRDVDGRPVSWQEARAIIAERYRVPEEVRKRTSARERRRRRDRHAEQKQRRREVTQVGKRLTLAHHLK
jgi:transposase